MSAKQRARPLAPDDRRKAIITAVVPLLLESGGSVTTAQIAEAAGIAEGTIFRVFPDKSSLVYEACKSSFDPAPELDALANIEKDLPFEIKLRKVAAILLKRAERVYSLAAVLRSMPSPPHATLHQAHKNAMEANSLLFWGLTRIFDDASEGLAVEPGRAAAAFRGLLNAVSFPFNDPKEQITADEAIEILLHGIGSKESS